MPKKFSRIYGDVLDHCSPIEFEPPWDCVTPDSDCLRLDATAEELTQSLLARFDIEVLIQSGVMTRSGHDTPALNPKLISEDRIVLALRDRQGVVINIMTSRGICGERILFFAMLEDAKTRHAVEHECRTLFVVFSFQDLLLCRSLGLPVTIATNLDRLNFAGLSLLATVTDSKTFADESWIAHRRFPAPVYDSVLPEGYLGNLIDLHYPMQLIFIAGGLFQPNCDIPDGMNDIARHLADADRHCRLRLLDAYVWWLTSDEVANLTFRRNLRKVELIREFFFKSGRKCHKITEFTDPSSPPSRSDPKADLCETLGELITLSSQRPFNSDKERKYRKLKDTYDKIVDVDLFRPMVEMAMDSNDPVEKNSRIVLAHLFKQLHGVMPILETAILRSSETNRVDDSTVIMSADQLALEHRLVELTLKLSKSVCDSNTDQW